jgi:hypothetical protein
MEGLHDPFSEEPVDVWEMRLTRVRDHLTDFYTNRAPLLNWVMGSAYPGFNDFYEEGGAGSGYFTIPHSMERKDGSVVHS